jgi:hypothetical protein
MCSAARACGSQAQGCSATWQRCAWQRAHAQTGARLQRYMAAVCDAADARGRQVRSYSVTCSSGRCSACLKQPSAWAGRKVAGLGCVALSWGLPRPIRLRYVAQHTALAQQPKLQRNLAALCRERPVLSAGVCETQCHGGKVAGLRRAELGKAARHAPALCGAAHAAAPGRASLGPGSEEAAPPVCH